MLCHSIVSQHFMEPEGSMPNSQQLSTCSYPEPPNLISRDIKIIMSLWSKVRRERRADNLAAICEPIV
jgi:hypothetical protein